MSVLPHHVRALLPRRGLLVGAVGSALLLPLLQPTVAAADNRFDIPAGSALRIEGKGYGHGKGLSQYGAQGAARRGVGHREIVEFYYPGTQWGTVAGKVKVRLSATSGGNNVVVRPRTHLRVRDTGAKQTHFLPANGATQWRLRVNAKNRDVVQWRTGSSTWKRWKVLRGEGFFAAGGRPVTLVTTAGDKKYRGRLRNAAPTPGSRTRDTVNIVGMENYLRGVVPLEIPASWHPEAVRAQAVAARTYATFERSRPMARHHQICDTTQCQVYGGASAEHKLSDAAIKATARSILTYDGAPAFTQFSSSNGGWAAAGSMPYQVSKMDPYDGWAGNPVHNWSVSTTAAALQRAWPGVGTLTRINVNKRDGAGDFGGRVLEMTLVGTRGKVKVTGDQVRFALGLRSNWFTFVVLPPKRNGVR